MRTIRACRISSAVLRFSAPLILTLGAVPAAAQDGASAGAAAPLLFAPPAGVTVTAETVTIEPDRLSLWLALQVADGGAEAALDAPQLDLAEIFGMTPQIPPDGDNLIDLQVAVDDAPVAVTWRATAVTETGDDVTGQLQAASLPLSPFDAGLEPALTALDPATSGRLAQIRAVAKVDGMDMALPSWIYRASARFALPAGEHALALSYRGQEGISMLFPALAQDEEDYRAYWRDNFCFDPVADPQLKALMDAAPDVQMLEWPTREIAYRPTATAGSAELTLRVALEGEGTVVRGCGMDFQPVAGGVQAALKPVPELRAVLIDTAYVPSEGSSDEE